MELNVTKNRQWLETVADCRDIENRLKYDRAPRCIDKFRLRQ